MAPQIEILKNKVWELRSNNGFIILMRIKPYPPSFNKIPARIIEPATGASTWALGSHKWVTYSGIFTKKAIVIASPSKKVQEEVNGAYDLKRNKLDPEVLKNIIDLKSRGKEAVTVYIIKYILACRRSGW